MSHTLLSKPTNTIHIQNQCFICIIHDLCVHIYGGGVKGNVSINTCMCVSYTAPAVYLSPLGQKWKGGFTSQSSSSTQKQRSNQLPLSSELNQDSMGIPRQLSKSSPHPSIFHLSTTPQSLLSFCKAASVTISLCRFSSSSFILLHLLCV